MRRIVKILLGCCVVTVVLAVTLFIVDVSYKANNPDRPYVGPWTDLFGIFSAILVGLLAYVAAGDTAAGTHIQSFQVQLAEVALVFTIQNGKLPTDTSVIKKWLRAWTFASRQLDVGMIPVDMFKVVFRTDLEVFKIAAVADYLDTSKNQTADPELQQYASACWALMVRLFTPAELQAVNEGVKAYLRQ
jgi:hypothetical protein